MFGGVGARLATSAPHAASNGLSGVNGHSPFAAAAATATTPRASSATRPPPPTLGAELSSAERKRKEAAALAALADLGFEGLTVTDLGKLVQVDAYERELDVMAEVRAYFKVAYKVCAAAVSCSVFVASRGGLIDAVSFACSPFCSILF